MRPILLLFVILSLLLSFSTHFTDGAYVSQRNLLKRYISSYSYLHSANRPSSSAYSSYTTSSSPYSTSRFAQLRVQDTDPCTSSPCDPFAQCTTTGPTTYACACLIGYKGNGSVCNEIDGCAGNPCGDHSTCRKNGPGKHLCTCDPNFVQNGPVCVPIQDHTIEEQIDAADKAVDELKQVEEQKSQYMADLGRQQKLEELEARVAELNKDKKERETAEEAHQLDHVEHRVEDVEMTANHISETSRVQAKLIKELKAARDATAFRRRQAVEAEAKRILELAKAAANAYNPPPAQPRTPYPQAQYTPNPPPNGKSMAQNVNVTQSSTASAAPPALSETEVLG